MIQLIRKEINRTQFIGGSDAAGILASSRWDSPLRVWGEKTGMIQTEDISLRKEVIWGRKVEPIIAEIFSEETGLKVQPGGDTIFHPVHGFIGATVDFLIEGEDAGLECKSCSPWKAKEWEGEEIPHEYILQCFHYLAVTGMKKWYLACAVGNHGVITKVIERDERVINLMIEREVAFWNGYVIPKVMPGIHHVSKNDKDTLLELFPQAVQSEPKQLGDEANKIIEGLESFKADKKHLEGLIALHENQLKLLLGDAEQGITPLYKISWKNSVVRRLDQDRFKEDFPDLYTKYYKSNPTRRFDYRKIKENTDDPS